LGLFRPSGFTAEPSTFAGVMILLLTCDALLAGKVSVRLTLLVAALNILTLSTAAWLFAGSLILLLLIPAPGHRASRLLVVCAFVVAAGLVLPAQYLNTEIAKFSRTSSLRTSSITYALKERPSWQNLVGPASNGAGSGYYALSTPQAGEAQSASSTSDDGTLVYLFILYGAAGVALYLALIVHAYRRLSLQVFLLLALATVTKMTPDATCFVILAAAAGFHLFPGRRMAATDHGGAARPDVGTGGANPGLGLQSQ
jgi:hypothetical protein